MFGMTPAEMTVAIEQAKTRCTCPGCPTYTRCAKNGKELLFCSTGKSFLCISGEKKCICPACPIAGEYGLKYTLFCTRGSEKAQRYEHALWGTKII